MQDQTTTSKFRVAPDYCRSVQECIAIKKGKKTPSNPRYKLYEQVHFTAGDVEQFQEYRDPTNGRLCIPKITMTKNRFDTVELPEAVYWEKYKNIPVTAIDDTFSYLFHKFKKGIFIKIKNGKLDVFLPFSKKHFVNEWSDKIKIDPKYGDLDAFVRHIQVSEGRKYFPNAVNRSLDTWYANNCLVRYEYPIHEGDTNNPVASDMFTTLCRERELPDMEFFVNRRDFPLLKKDGTEPYNHMFDGENVPLLSHNYDKYAPILSMVGGDNFADIPMPTSDDWSRVMRKEGKFFPHNFNRSFSMESTISWKDKKPIAIFRGSTTGCGVTIETNPRLKLAYLSKVTPKDADGLPLLDAGITGWNLRPRKYQGEKYLKTIDFKNLPFGLVPQMTPQEQTSYKYLINVDGHVSAFRLSLELESGCCILLADSKYKLWYRHLLKPYVHYVPVKADLSDLVSQVKWCKKHDKECEEIAGNAREFARTYLTKDGMLDYMQKLLLEVKKQNGVYFYNSIDLQDVQFRLESRVLAKRKKEKLRNKVYGIPKTTRNYGFLQGMEYLIFNELNSVKDGTVLFENENTTIRACTFDDYPVIKKTKKDIKDITHEAFVSLCCMNQASRYTPNFLYVYAMYSDEKGHHLIMEDINGETLADYIHSDNFNFNEFLSILVQIALSLQIAQNFYGFIHYDLKPWNIMLRRENEPVNIQYQVSHNTVYNIQTDVIPVIVDMGRSHIYYKEQHYSGTPVRMFSFSTIIDIVMLLVSSINQILQHELSQYEVNQVIRLANFFSGTKYRERPFMASGKGGMGDLKYFFNRMDKHIELLTSEKYELEQKTPVDFVTYVANFFGKNKLFTVTSYLAPRYLSNPKQVVMYATTAEVSSEKGQQIASELGISSSLRAMTGVMVRLKDYFDIAKDIVKCGDYFNTDPFFIEYVYGNLLDTLYGMRRDMVTYLIALNEPQDNLVRQYDKIIDGFRVKYLDMINSSPVKMKYKTPKVDEISYRDDIFLQPKKVAELLEGIKGKELPVNLLSDIEVIYYVLGRKDNPINTGYYYENFKKILNTFSTVQLNTVNINTLRNLSKVIFSENVKLLEEQADLSCKQVQKYLALCDTILKV